MSDIVFVLYTFVTAGHSWLPYFHLGKVWDLIVSGFSFFVLNHQSIFTLLCFIYILTILVSWPRFYTLLFPVVFLII